MRKTQQKRRNKFTNTKEKIIQNRVTFLSLGKNRWVTRKKTISPYPYLITISYYKSNVFFTVADIKGYTRE
jgi:hypothetical protein